MDLQPFAVERWFGQYEFQSRFNIAESCARPLTVTELMALDGQGWDLSATRLSYGESDGAAELRGQIAALYPGADPDNVLVTVGAIEANFVGLSALCGPGDRVIVMTPTYQQLYEVPRAQGAAVEFWQLRPENRWQPDLDELRQLLRSPAKLVVVNLPNNPTGTAVDRHYLKELVSLCRDRGTTLYSDEVYRGLNLAADSGQPSLWEMAPGECVAVGSLSKAYGLPGLRVGWLVAPYSVKRRSNEIRDYTSICCPALSERLAAAALRARVAILSEQRAHALSNLALVNGALSEFHGALSWVPPVEGVVGFVRHTSTIGSREYATRLVEQTGTLVVPGDCFGSEGYFRLGFGYETANLIAGLDRLLDFARSIG